jgi:tetratricopeptide (TPR) repeat protein
VPHVRKQAFKNRFLQRLGEEISPTAHAHVEGESIAEIMPWLWLSIRANPRNLEVYLVTAFWLAGQAGRPDLALDVLAEAQHNNPFSYVVHLERGRIYLAQNMLQQAGREFDAGLEFWPGEEEPDSEDARAGKRNLLLHRALLYEVDGKREKAMDLLGEVMRLYPDQGGFGRRLEKMAKGEQPDVPAGDVLQALLRENAKARECRRCGDPESDHEARVHDHDH